MTTTEIYYNKGYEEGKKELLNKIGVIMDEVGNMTGKMNPRYTLDWNKGFDDGVRTFYTKLELALRKEMLGDKE